MSEKKLSDQSTRSNQPSISIDWSYADAPESTSHVTFSKHYGLFIDDALAVSLRRGIYLSLGYAAAPLRFQRSAA